MCRRVRAVLASMLLLVTVVACTGDERAPAAPGTFSVALGEPASLLPAEITDLPGRLVADAVWTPLTAPGDGQGAEPEPLAAESITSTDQRSWTIRLRAGMRFHDGTPVTAQAYVDTWEAAEREGWAGATVLTETLRAEKFRATGERTIELVLERPLGQVPLILGSTALLPLPPSAVAARDWAGFARHPVGNGPYRLAEDWRPGAGARLTRFEGYRGPRPGTAREIGLRVAADAAEQYELARTGEVDLATEVPGDQHHRMAEDFGDRVLMWPLPELTMLGVPAGDERFADAASRHAIALAIDRAALEEGPLGHQVDLASALLPPAMPLGHRSGTCRPCNHDPRAAQALWEQAGKPAPELAVHFAEGTGQESWVRPLAEQLGDMLGSTARPSPVPAAEYRELLERGTADGLFVLSHVLRTRSPHELLAPLRSGAGSNRTGYASEGFDQMMAEAGGAAELGTSGELYRLAENQLLRDLPVIPLWSRHGHAVWGERLGGVTASPNLAIDLAAIDVPS
ncbi:peptide ABC transporter substrate-binding protein [Amycolatopsis cihanbeyliensis]|uniref:Oligopeptide transport system substrate-binding protein n=1 Tax=Amycolatopsis cihanbeyliensis TaxID=1128664 RepID=A0A542CUT0_AMYCI|nr:ABC transporter substrate-binding protein [Amycolatopsis cihanbeyliensis]TQI94573.1 oligopeptide transport system substrate-binding protein [Amycolatopsis cihanbeyliensis]